jgi:hypothetical protein
MGRLECHSDMTRRDTPARRGFRLAQTYASREGIRSWGLMAYCNSIGCGTGIWKTEEDLRIFRSSKNHILGKDLEGRSKRET